MEVPYGLIGIPFSSGKEGDGWWMMDDGFWGVEEGGCLKWGGYVGTLSNKHLYEDARQG